MHMVVGQAGDFYKHATYLSVQWNFASTATLQTPKVAFWQSLAGNLINAAIWVTDLIIEGFQLVNRLTSND